MKKKTIIKIIIGSVAVIAICITLIFAFKTKKEDKITIAMTKDETISILEKNNYKYNMNKDLIVVKEISFQNIKGHLSIYLDSQDKVRDVAFFSDLEDLSEKVKKLDKYLCKTYGEVKHSDEASETVIKYWNNDNIEITFSYPKNNEDDMSNICISWAKK